MSNKIQFPVSDSEYEELKKRVEGKGVTIPQYVKDLVFPKEETFEKIWNEFLEKLEVYPSKIPFNVAYVMGEKWDTFNRSTKLSVSRLFNKKVTSGEFDNIELVGRSSGNVSIYKKLS